MSRKTKKIIISVEFDAIVPASMTEEEIQDITLELDPSAIDIYGMDGEQVEGSEVLGYTTGAIEEAAP